MLDRTPKVFISYSWTSKEYQESVISLAKRMRHDGVDVKLDVWDLKEGQDKYAYMEQCVSDESIDRVLILSDRIYAEKADNRKGGVGNETTIISSEIYDNADQQKFIPVVMERNANGQACLPKYLKSLFYRDLSGDKYEAEYEALLRNIYEVPIHRKPEIGERPKWLTEDTSDTLYDIKNIGRKIDLAELDKIRQVTIREFLDTYIEALKPFYKEHINEEEYLKLFFETKEYRNVFLNHLNSFSKLDDFGSIMAEEFERLFNALYDINTFKPGASSCSSDDFDLFRVHVWELFICTVAYMLHFDMYRDIHELLVHTYFLRRSPLGSETEPCSYVKLRFYSKMLEERIKPGLSGELANKFTLTGHYMVSAREYMPIYSSKSLANADLLLYQVYECFGTDVIKSEWGVWFPTLYVYADRYDSIWKKLTSRRFCRKIMPLFGVETLDDLKVCLYRCIRDRKYRYEDTWVGAPSILSWIKIEDVAIYP
ncbi:SEFIR domain-containing protein [Selenomonas sp. KH1T6]|uniref:SEFIR domain-containing protein n=1 Tax=Selenomonas sp. KH1T6 TaxID=3158784 RepID=UPI0008A74527|nr:SEFIR domain-containing protein [Selenomonas ruminantium]